MMHYKINRWTNLIIHEYKCLVIQNLISQGTLHGNQGNTNTPNPTNTSYVLHHLESSRIQMRLAFLAF